MIRYFFKEDHVFALPNADKADPQKIGEEFAKIEKINGELKPQAVVDAARSPRNTLHKFFEWNDSKAAHRYRLDQARTLIRAIAIVDKSPGDRGKIRAYVSVSDTKGSSYRNVQSVIDSAELQTRVLKQAERELLAWENRYRELEDICSIVKAGRDKIRDQIAANETRV